MGIKKTIHDIAVLCVGVVLVLTLFLVHYAVSQVGTHYQEKLTGQVIQISEGDSSDIVIEDPSSSQAPEKPPEPPPAPLSKNLQCWADAGITRTDMLIVGNLLENTPCKEEQERPKITVKKQSDCVVVDSDNQVVTQLCESPQSEAPKIDISFPESQGISAPLIPQQRNYAPWFLFILFGISVMVVSREHSFAFGLKEKDEHVERDEDKEIKYIEAAPLFDEKKIKSDIQDLERMHHKLLAGYTLEKPSFASIRILPEEITAMIKEFNEQTRAIYNAIKKNDAATARRVYLDIFPLYTRLYNALKQERRQELQEVITYLHHQITIMEKSSTITHLIEEAYRQTERHKVSGKSTNEKKTVEKLQKEIMKLKTILREKKK